jgi:hypothetical protein
MRSPCGRFRRQVDLSASAYDHVVAAVETRQAKNILFKQYIDPLLDEWGFVRHRRTYRLRSDRDDYVIVDFQSAAATTKQRYGFYVNLVSR